MSRALTLLAAVKPPKSVLFTEDMTAAMGACPLLAEMASLEELPFNAGVKSALSSIYDAFVDNGLDGVLETVTLDRLQSVEEKIKDGLMETLLSDLPNLKPMMRAKDPFAVGIVLGFGTVYDVLQDEESGETPSDEEDEGEEEGEMGAEDVLAALGGEPARPKRPANRPGAPVELISILEALQGAGISFKRVQIVPETSEKGSISLAIHGSFRAPVRFSDVAKINAVFKMADPDADIELAASDEAPDTIKFSYKV